MLPLLLPMLAGLALGAAGELLQGDKLRGTALRVMRTQRGLSGAELARRADLSRPYLVQIENGERRAPRATWAKILDALGSSLEELESLVVTISNMQAEIATAEVVDEASPGGSIGAAAAGRYRSAVQSDSAYEAVRKAQGMASAATAIEGVSLLQGLLRRASRLEPAELRLLLAYCEALEAGAASRPEQQGRKCSVCGYQGHDKRYCPRK